MSQSFYIATVSQQPKVQGQAATALLVCHRLFKEEKYAEAWGACQVALAREQYDPAVLNAAGTILCKLKQPKEAIAFFHKALQAAPMDANLLGNLGNAYQETLAYELAEQYHRRALAILPHHAQCQRNLADSLARLGRDEEAIELYQRTLYLEPGDPAASWGLATSLLRVGRLAEGWLHFERRWYLNPKNPPRQLPRPRWDGGHLQGRTVLLYCEQGFGDTIHCLRYLPLVKAKGGKVILEVHPEMVGLCAGLAGADLVIGRGQGQLPEFDVHFPLLSCPLLFTPSLQDIPAAYPYLPAKRQNAERFGKLLRDVKGSLTVGLVWSGSPEFPENHHRSMALSHLVEGLAQDGVTLFSLQKGPASRELTASGGPASVVDLAAHCQDFADTAGALQQLDLVIMTDTAVAHLAGALNKPVWVLAPFFAHWVWGRRPQTSCLWYPSLRIFRQTAPGDWSAPLQEARLALAHLAGR